MKNSKFWEAVYVDATPSTANLFANLNSEIFSPLAFVTWGASSVSAGGWPIHAWE